MRILVHDYAGHPFQVQLSRALAARGHDVLHAYAGALQTPRGELNVRPDDPKTFATQEVHMNPAYSQFKYNFRKRRRMELAYGAAAATLLTTWKPDVVLSANTPTETQERLIRAAQKSGARFVYWLQDFYSLAVDKLVRKKLPLIGPLVGGYYRRLDKRHFALSHSIVTITEDFNPILEKQFGVDRKKIHVVPNWAPLETLPSFAKSNSWAQSAGLAEYFVFLYSGTLGMKHNPDFLLGIALQHQNNPLVKVIVVSEGLGANWLMDQKIKKQLENIHILPYQPVSQLAQVLSTGDVLLGVLEEDAGIFSVPSKVLSYLCAGRPTLLASPSVNLAARILRETESGITVASQDKVGFLEAATRLLNDEPLRQRMGANARRYAEANFEIKAVTDRFESILAASAT